MRFLTTLTALFVLSHSLPSSAQLPAVGAVLSAVDIDDKGSITIEGDDMVYQPWSSRSMAGTVIYLQHMAARAEVEGTYKPLDDALEAKKYGPDQLRSVAIVNQDDAMWGTGVFVSGQLKKNKLRYPDSTIVLDADGKARKQWQLEPKGAALAILSPTGEVMFFRQGPLTEAEIEEALAVITTLVEG